MEWEWVMGGVLFERGREGWVLGLVTPTAMQQGEGTEWQRGGGGGGPDGQMVKGDGNWDPRRMWRGQWKPAARVKKGAAGCR